jgi:L-threonylcarbamoyladenylate synthase
VNRKITQRLTASPEALQQAATLLRNGGTVAFPTETVYGLGANALDPAAVEKIFAAKQRPSWDPLIVHVTNESQLQTVVDAIPPAARALMDAFWPGPLTLLLPKSAQIPAIVTAGRERVGVRMPRHPVARQLIELAGVPIAAPSANSFGRTSPTRADFVLEDLDGRIDAVVDAGEATLGLESTVVDVVADPPILYRPGMVTLQQLQSLCPQLMAYRDPGEETPEAHAAPGLGLRHYSPKARLVLVEELTDVLPKATTLEQSGERVGVLLPSQLTAGPPFLVYRWGSLEDYEELARRLFAGLRELDAAGATVIVCPLPRNQGLGVAMRDRLFRAAR